MMMIKVVSLALLICGFRMTHGDMYMHNPRGSNNRCDEQTRARKNANRLFDSQNNQRGGYNVGSHPGKMYFYAGSEMEIQWANQHSCGDQNNFCEIVIQYMCDDNVRDGRSTNTAPVHCASCERNKRYGHHESLTYYEHCGLRERNKGLFTANRLHGNGAGKSAQYTRQNDQGTRYGFECPEERDYYPYWGPTPWKDIAVVSRGGCGYYKGESQNVKSRWACDLPEALWKKKKGRILTKAGKRKRWAKDLLLSNDKESCEQIELTLSGVKYKAKWKEFPAHGIDPPVCVHEPWSRDNHQGNTIGGEFPSFKWKIPDIDADHCTLRIRYNISTNDFDSWDTNHTKNVDADKDRLGPDEIYKNYQFTGGNAEAKEREYFLKDNPELDVFNANFKLRIAVNTAQYGRTFQDRSHSFAIRKRPAGLSAAKIHNVNVRGKRGNIVQVFPSTEYDFVPNVLQIKTGHHVHFQWTGSDRNPQGNTGEGKAKTDRNNIVQLGYRPYEEGLGGYLTLGSNYARVLNEQGLWGLSKDEVKTLAFNGGYINRRRPGNLLDRADAYYDYGVAQIMNRGTYYYMCTRNNNFSNRDQKATIIVT